MKIIDSRPETDDIHYSCLVHTEKRWSRKNDDHAPLQFIGEINKKYHFGLVPPLAHAMKQLMGGKLKRDEIPVAPTPDSVMDVAELYAVLERYLAFECDCPNEALVVAEGE